MIETRQEIKDYYGKILGYIDYNPNTKVKTARTYLGIILGTYSEKENITRMYNGQILANGDMLTSLIYSYKG